MGNVMETPDLATLIATHKGERSYDALSTLGGGKPTPERWHQLATKPVSRFPSPDTIQAIAKALGISQLEVVAAVGRSVGLDINTGHDSSTLTIAQAGDLPASARAALRSVAGELLHLHRAATTREDGEGHEERPAPMNQGPTGPNLTAVPEPDASDDDPLKFGGPPEGGWAPEIQAELDQLAAREGNEDNPPDTTTGEHNQDPGGHEPS